MEGPGQDADGDGNTQIGGDGVVVKDVSGSSVAGRDVIMLSDSPNSIVNHGNLSINQTQSFDYEKLAREMKKLEREYQPKGDEISLLELMNSQKTLKVTWKQRPFVWNPEHVQSLFSELILGTGQLNFGNILILDEPDSPFIEIVDGGQRITALTIIFSAIRDYLHMKGDIEFASNIHTRLIYDHLGIGAKFLPSNRISEFRDYYAKSIQSYPNPDFTGASGTDNLSVWKSYTRIMEDLLEQETKFIQIRLKTSLSIKNIRLFSVTTDMEAFDVYEILAPQKPMSKKEYIAISETLRDSMARKGVKQSVLSYEEYLETFL